jgi:hypothetical protein
MTEFATFTIDAEQHEPASDVIQTRKGFIRKFLVRTDTDVHIVTVFAKELSTLMQDTIKVRFPADFCFAVE